MSAHEQLCECGCGLRASETSPHRLVTYTLAELMRLTDEQLDQLESLTDPLSKALWWELTRAAWRDGDSDKRSYPQKGGEAPL